MIFVVVPYSTGNLKKKKKSKKVAEAEPCAESGNEALIG